ncbi:MAG: LytTR family DNA-binding domain-containing protein [Chitinophagaceae bacterium]
MGLFNCVIVEDNPIDRALLEDYISSSNLFRIAGSFSHPLESLELLQGGDIAVLFSDIDMPGINGIDFFKSLQNPPLCIFVTVHPEFAIDAFDVHAVDYVLKPLRPGRLDKAIQRTMELMEIRSKALQYDLRVEKDYLMIKEGTLSSKVNISDIIYLEALTNYTKIITREKKYITLQNLKNFMEYLPPKFFLRIHRSYAVAVNRISGIDTNELIVEEQRLPLGKTYRNEVRKFVRTS